MATEVHELKVGVVASGQFAMNVFHYKIADPSNADEYAVSVQLLEALNAGGAGTRWTDKYRGVMSNQAFISSFRVKRVSPSGGNTAAQAFTAATFPGTVVEEIHSQQIAGCVIWASDDDPGKTGRNFFPGVPETFILGSRWDNTGLGAYNAFVAKHVTGFSVAAGIFLPVVYKRSDETHFDIDGGYCSPLIGTQRRREVPV